MSEQFIKTKAVALAFALTLGFCGSVAGAQTKSVNLQAERQQLFDQMMLQPDNLEVAFSYAALSVRVGDIEGAISTLERMLIFSPGLPRLQLELGILYYRLASFETARSYFKSVITAQETSEEISLKAQEYLALVEKKLERLVWSTRRFVGLRWQSNANSAPEGSTILSNGITFTLSDDSVRNSDFSFVTTGNAHLEYDLYNQGDKIEVDYVDFATFHFDETRFDALISEITFGPSFNLGRFEIDETFAGVYGIANGSLLDGKTYFGTLGAGARIVARPQQDLELVLKGEFRRQWFNNTARRKTATQRNGNEFRGTGEIKYMFSPMFRGVLSGRLLRRDARIGFYDHWEYGGYSRFDWAFSPAQTTRLPWVLTALGGYVRRDYDDPDPRVSLTKTQKDNEYWVGGILKVPLNKTWAFMPKVEYRQVDSNNPVRAYKAFTATIGVQFSQ